MLEAFGDRMQAPAGMQKLVDDDRKGRKNGKGFYKYGKGEKGVDESVYALLGVTPNAAAVSADDIAWRCTLMMVNEACRCFGEGILRSARDGDIGAIFGLGFPPSGRSLPLRRLRRRQGDRPPPRGFRAKYGDRFEPAPILVHMAEHGGTFHGDDAVKPGEIPSSGASTSAHA